jgi:hypothetical protein
MDESGVSATRTPRGNKLPAFTLSDVREIVNALAELAAPSSRERIASHTGKTVSGPFKRRLAAAKYFGFVSKQGAKLAITERGDAFLAEEVAAKRSAVMGTGFGPVIQSFSSKLVNDAAIEARLQDDCGVPEKSAPALRAVLVSSAEDAGLISGNKFDPEAIESVSEEDVGSVAASPPAQGKQGTNGAKRDASKERSAPKKETPPPSPESPPPVSQAPVQIIFQVDASKMDPGQLADLITALRNTS